MALKKSVLVKAPLLWRSKNLNALNKNASRLTLDEALNCIFCRSSASKLYDEKITLRWC